jgi:signal transduction histidine kinase
MSAKIRVRPRSSLIARYRLVLLAVWTAVICAELIWNVSLVRENTRENAHIQAQTTLEKDIVYRRWNASHGGVYAPVDETTRPNPYLVGVREREILTPSRRELTLINPAYMTRQVYDLAPKESGVFGHITSLNPVRPGNAADPWEAAALRAFEGGGGERNSVESMGGKDYLRLIRPLVTETGCLQCHAQQGYKVGQVRGGISVAVPMAPLLEKAGRLTLLLSLGHVLVWVAGVLVIFIGGRRMIRGAEELEEANRNAELFTDIMRHDLISPVGAMKGYTDLLLHREEDPGKKALLERMQVNSRNLVKMIESAALYAKIDQMREIKLEQLDLGEIVRNAAEDLKEEREKKEIAIEGLPLGELPAEVSPLVGNVFSNLLSNAVKFSPPGSSIEIGVGEKGGHWEFFVRDHGPGIPEESRGRLFTRFERLGKTGVKGAGLGLAIAGRIVSLHGGEVRVEDTPGGGSTFFVKLPRHALSPSHS